MSARKQDLTLVEFVEVYVKQREITPGHAARLRHRCAHFTAFVGGTVLIADVDCDAVNDWLAELATSGLAPHTRHCYRGDLLCVWNCAYMDGLNEHPPLRVRKVKRPRLLVKAYTHAEIRQLLDGAAKLRGFDQCGNRRADFWQAIIYAAYATGLRRGDLLRVPRESVAADGLYTAVQHKTNYPVTVRFCSDTLHHASKLRSDSGLLLPWPYALDAFGPSFVRVMKAGGVTRGSFRWLRRSAGSYAESQAPGAGAALLGHRDPGVFKKHYEDSDLTQQRPIEPPPMPPSPMPPSPIPPSPKETDDGEGEAA
jgi:integrase